MSGDLNDASPGLVDLLEAMGQRSNGLVHGPIPGKVLEYVAATQRATVQPVIGVANALGVAQPWPPVRDVPVAFPSWAGGAITWPVPVGSYVMLIPQDADISAWKASGTEGQLPPDQQRSCSWSDCIAIPCSLPGGSPLGATMYSTLGPVIAGSQVFLVSSTAADFVALASKVDQELSEIRTWALAHGHPNFGVPASATVPPLLPTVVPTGSTKVHAE
jgi:hypothetical protein